MKKIILLLIFLPSISFAQKCKIEKATDPATGKTGEMVTTSTMTGKIMVVRTDEGLMLIYSTKLLMSLGNKTNSVSMDIDSVRFFSKGKSFTLTAKGQGMVSNTPSIKPQFKEMTFYASLDEKTKATMLIEPLDAIQVFGKKDSEGSDALTGKQKEKLTEAFNCLK